MSSTLIRQRESFCAEENPKSIHDDPSLGDDTTSTLPTPLSCMVGAGLPVDETRTDLVIAMKYDRSVTAWCHEKGLRSTQH